MSHLALLAAVLAAVSVYPAYHFKKKNDEAQRALQYAQSTLAQANAFNRDIEAAFKGMPRTEAKPIRLALADVMAYLRSTRNVAEISVESIVTERAASSREGKPVEDVSEALPGAGGVKRIPIRVRGHYRTYEGMQAFLNGLNEMPVAKTGIEVNGREFTLALSVLGM